MQEWFEDGRYAWLVASLIAAEMLIVSYLSARHESRRRLLGLLPTIASGGLLALSFSAYVAGLDWRIGASLLGFAGILHLLDMWRRWRGSSGR